MKINKQRLAIVKRQTRHIRKIKIALKLLQTNLEQFKAISGKVVSLIFLILFSSASRLSSTFQDELGFSWCRWRPHIIQVVTVTGCCICWWNPLGPPWIYSRTGHPGGWKFCATGHRLWPEVWGSEFGDILPLASTYINRLPIDDQCMPQYYAPVLSLPVMGSYQTS